MVAGIESREPVTADLSALPASDFSHIIHRPGIIAALGELGPGAVIMEKGLAELFGRHESSVKRAVKRGELPAPTRLFGQNVWTAGVVVQHLESRLKHEAKEYEQKAEEKQRLMTELSP
jgi:hypothetical protein